MAIDFTSIAAAARQRHETKVSTEEDKRRLEREAREALVKRGVDFLKIHVLPPVETAKAAFLADNIVLDVTTEFNVAGYASRLPNIKLQMSRQSEKRNDGYRIKSSFVFLSSNGENLTAHISKEFGSSPDHKIGIGPVDRTLEAAIIKLSQNFYEAVERG